MGKNNYPGTGNSILPVKKLVSLFVAEDERWALWSPVFLGLGIGIYFSLPVEPPLWLGAGAILTVFLVVARLRAGGYRVLGVGLGLIAAGFTVAQWRTAMVEAPVLAKRIEAATIVGRLTRVEHFPKSVRITLELPRISRLSPERTPLNIRLRLRGKQPDMYPGYWIRVRGALMAPPQPAAPGSFDFQRQSYFRRLGAVGFAFGRAEVTARGEGGGLQQIWLGLAMVRQKISEKILAAVPGTTGAIAAALMTGDRSAIPEATLASIRNSGLAHLLAVSGLHIGLVAGILFFGIRAMLSLFPVLALHFPIKKWAAVAATAGAFTYAMLAGATVPSQRAFLMVGLVLLAVIVDRRALSMRTIAWAAAIVLLVQPESMLGASFQMSFGAVVALIAAYEFLGDRSRNANMNIHDRSILARLLIYAGLRRRGGVNHRYSGGGNRPVRNIQL